MEPQKYHDLMRQLAEIHWQHLQRMAEQDPTLTRLQRVLEQDRAIQHMNSRALRDFCATLAVKYGLDNARDA